MVFWPPQQPHAGTQYNGLFAHFRGSTRGRGAAQVANRGNQSGGGGERPRRLRGTLAVLTSAAIGAAAVVLYQVPLVWHLCICRHRPERRKGLKLFAVGRHWYHCHNLLTCPSS